MFGTQLPTLGASNSIPPCPGLSSKTGAETQLPRLGTPVRSYSVETQLPRLGTPISVPTPNPHWPAWRGRR